ncbi:MAG: DUF58 domain-containing protein [Acidimicrobiales bacterium]
MAAEGEHVDVTLERRRDDRIVAYAVVAAASLVLALFTARVEIAAFGAPFAVTLALARRSATGRVAATVAVDSPRAVEGDDITGAITVTSCDPGGTVELLMTPSFDLTAIDPAGTFGWELPSDPTSEPARFTLRAERWGTFVVGPTAVRLRDPHALTYWEGSFGGPRLLVLPSATRLDSILEPRSSRTTAGFHLARRALGAGTDFAELQEYRPGDRLRDLNRAASARLGAPIVNRYHPERSGEVVVLLDTFIDPSYELSATSRRAIVVAVRAAWALARAHLTAQDRVGVATVGRIPVWLSPTGGARARYAILEALLAVGTALDGGRVRGDTVDSGRIPPAALVVYMSPLWDDRYLTFVERLQMRGRETAVIHLANDQLLDEPADDAEQIARRLFDVSVADRAARLRAAGINVVTWDRGADLGAVVRAAAQRQARRRAVRT